MAITKETIIDKIEFVGEHRIMQLREATVIKEDGIEISRSFHRRTLSPNDDISLEDTEIQSMTTATWTQAIKDSYTAFLAAQT